LGAGDVVDRLERQMRAALALAGFTVSLNWKHVLLLAAIVFNLYANSAAETDGANETRPAGEAPAGQERGVR
jgi:hypothetical protein